MLVQNCITQEKPFACDVKGCEMTFTNKDHLDWHHKKHEMMLNLGLVNKTTANEVADQTPTPTRFIRNCEEIGLFQDLQNVNPFDEIFKKAVDSVKNGETLEVHTNNSNDTLHTPHILPHNIENTLKQTNAHLINSSEFEVCVFPSSNHDDSSNDSSYHDDSSNHDDSSSDSTIIVIDDDDEINLKKKIRENIQNKISKDLQRDKTSPVISVVPLQDLTYKKCDETVQDSTRNKNSIKVNHSQSVVPLQDLTYKKSDETVQDSTCNKNSIKENHSQSDVDTKLEKMREMNRAAQNRCRKRKQKLWREMEEQLAYLRQENTNLRRELGALRLLHSKCQPAYSQGAIITSIIKTEPDQTTPPAPVPLLIQFLPNTQLTQVSPETSAQPVKDNTIKNDKCRPLRKIVPNILRKSRGTTKAGGKVV